MILGFTWLRKHNPEIDFHTKTVKMTRCLPQCCTGCLNERKAERKMEKTNAQCINACRTGPFPAFVEDADDEEDEPTPEPEDEEDEPLEDGDRVWVAGLFPEAEYVRATTTVSQKLAEGFRQNSEKAPDADHIPPHLRDFHTVFSKDSFDKLPDPKL